MNRWKTLYKVGLIALLLSGCHPTPLSPEGHSRSGAAHQWHTCYAQNEERLGVWSGTSHHRVKAAKRALKRCRALSGYSGYCYLDYCRFW